MRVGLKCVLMVLALPALAQEGPSFDCAGATGDIETLICENTDLARLDRRLATRFDEAVGVAQGQETGASEAEAELRTAQERWIGERDACLKDTDPRSCVETEYMMREGSLVTTWMLEEPERTVTWVCGGAGKPELVTMFYDTELPSVRFVRGTETDVGSLSPTGSGSRYEGSAGRYIWIQGSEAIYRDPDPRGHTTSCTVSGEN